MGRLDTDFGHDSGVATGVDPVTSHVQFEGPEETINPDGQTLLRLGAVRTSMASRKAGISEGSDNPTELAEGHRKSSAVLVA